MVALDKKDGKGSLIDSFRKAVKSFSGSLPIIFGVVLLVGLFKTYMTEDIITSIFIGSPGWDTFLGASIGSISAGNPLTSYIIGGGLLDENVSLFAVTAFIVAWVTVGVVQLPAEAKILGKRFALTRNALSFVLSILVSITVVLILKVVP